MAFGPAIIESSLESKNIIIAGHRDSFFRNLGKLKEGDIIKLEKVDKNLSYKISNVISRFIINPSSGIYYKSGLIKEINNEKYIVIQRG